MTKVQALTSEKQSIEGRHCENKRPYVDETYPDRLFVECRATCSGFTYVLKGLLEAVGIPARIVRLYNIPKQGNHDGIDAEISPGQWAFFDPTFGTFFSSDGTVAGTPLSIQEVRYLFTRDSLGEVAFTAKRGILGETQLDRIYSKDSFLFPGAVDLDDYILAEILSPLFDKLSRPLVLSLKLENGSARAGVFGAKTIQEGQEGFSRWSNEALLDGDPFTDTAAISAPTWLRFIS